VCRSSKVRASRAFAVTVHVYRIFKMNEKMDYQPTVEMYDPKDDNFFDFQDGVAVGLLGGIRYLNTIVEGFGETDRIGKKIFITDMHISGSMKYLPTTGVIATRATYAIVYDKFPTGTLPTFQDVFNTSLYGFDMQNMDNESRFQIVHKKCFNLLAASTTFPTSKTQYYVNDYFAVGLPVVFKELGTGVIADVEEGAMYMVYCQSENNLDVNWVFETRTYFQDV